MFSASRVRLMSSPIWRTPWLCRFPATLHDNTSQNTRFVSTLSHALPRTMSWKRTQLFPPDNATRHENRQRHSAIESAASIPEEEWQAAFGLNLFAAVRLTNAVLPALRESKVGAIVNISSNAATMPFGPFAHYCAAKAALDMYSLALDLGPKGIRVNVVSPGPVTTPGGDEARKAFSDATGAPADVFAQSVPLGRLGSPDDVAEVVALLVSDRANWMTGANILVDGGMTALKVGSWGTRWTRLHWAPDAAR